MSENKEEKRLNPEECGNSERIRIPVHLVEAYNKILKTYRKLFQDNEREPSLEEISKSLNQDEESVKEVLRSMLSFYEQMHKEENGIIGDLSSNMKINQINNKQEMHAMGYTHPREEIAAYIKANPERLEQLLERERRILVLRYGLEGNEPAALEEVMKEMNLSENRIRQLESKAIRKIMGHRRRNRPIRDYLD